MMIKDNLSSQHFSHDMAHETNCSQEIPLSEDYFQDLIVAEKVMIMLSSLVVMATLAVFIEEVFFIVRHYNTSSAQKYRTIQLLSIYPGISLSALLCLLVPKTSVLCDQIIFMYISAVMYIFAALMLIHLNGKDRIVSLSSNPLKLQSPPCCCCCICCPKIKVNVKNLQRLMILILQNAISQPIFSSVTLVLWLDGKYTQGNTEFTNAFAYLTILSQTSFLLGLYALFMLFGLCKDMLKSVFIGPKFGFIQLILILALLQGGIFAAFAKFNMPSCRGILSSTVRGKSYFLIVLIFQILLLSVLSRHFYRRTQNSITQDIKDSEKAQINDSSICKLVEKNDNCEAEKPFTAETET